MSHLLNASEEAMLSNSNLSGRFLEAFVGCELLKQIEWDSQKPALMHYRRAAGQEVDYVLEEGAGRVVGIEVKSSHTVTTNDFTGLHCLSEDAGTNFVAGVILYAGDKTVPFGPHLWAIPIAEMWAE
jgi:hypothetical protein